MSDSKPVPSLREGRATANPYKIHLIGILLFLFIPLVLVLFLRYPFGVLFSFGVAILIMIAHRLVAIPFMNRFRKIRCLWCGRTSRSRVTQIVQLSKSKTSSPSVNHALEFEFCEEKCIHRALRFFDFCSRYAPLLRAGIFIPLAWYVVTMILNELKLIQFPQEWNHFIFQFFIACTVVSISFLHRTGREMTSPSFPFPIHNLFLLGIQNTLLVFRFVGIWWIAASLIFLAH